MYSISELEQLSGVQTHTIRIWERRYKALTPMRSAGNTRFYDDHQLRKLLNIVSLSQSGLKISQVCALSEQEIDNLLKKEIDSTVSPDANCEFYISQLLGFGLAYNEREFDELISKCIADFGLPFAYKNVIYPLLVRLGLMWRRDNICPAQEHFLSNIIRQKIFAAINQIPLKSKTKSTWLLFLPEDEDHDIGLLFANYMLRSYGQKVIFLGGRVPFESLIDAMLHNRIDHMLLFLVRSRPVANANQYLNQLAEHFQQTKIYIAGNNKLIPELALKGNVSAIQSIEAFEETIKTIKHGS